MSASSALKNGGWVLLLTAMLVCALLAWALGPAVLRSLDRPPGDGATIESFAFDLSDQRLPEGAAIEVAMAHRDLVPVMDDPIIMSPDEIAKANSGRSRYLVSDDLVIGVEINGAARAYPLTVLNVHEVVNDSLGGRDIAVTWHWPSAATAVVERRLDGKPVQLGVSGLVGGGNMLMYPRRPDGQSGEEPLFLQMSGRSITGDLTSLAPVPYSVRRWADWFDAHPDTTVIAARPEFKKRYKKGNPGAWMASSNLLFETPRPDHGPSAKSPVLILHGPGGTWGVEVAALAAQGGEAGVTEIELDGQPLSIATTQYPDTAVLVSPPPGWRADRAMWIAAHLLHPDLTLIEPQLVD